MSYIVRSKSSPLALLPAVRRAVDSVDRSLAIADVRTLQDALDRASAQMAFTMVLLAIAAAVALMLGVVGIYGAMSYIVSQRTSEVGVRLALGAEPTSITRMITQQGGLVALAGIAAGLIAAFAGSRLIASLLYDISPRDPGRLRRRHGDPAGRGARGLLAPRAPRREPQPARRAPRGLTDWPDA
jgi:ABC-type antimicrobial peptide transport system permease subunit